MHPALAALDLPSAQRHIFLCLGPDCCAAAEGERSWQHLKTRLKTLGLPVFRSKVGCLRVCSGGPVLVVYPEGTWYGGMTAARLDRFIDEHLVQGRPVQEWLIATHALPGPGNPPKDPHPVQDPGATLS